MGVGRGPICGISTFPQDSARPPESRLAPIFLPERHLVVSAPQVQLGEHCGSPHLVEDVLNAGQGVAIQRRLHVEGAVVSTLPKIRVISFLIFLPHHDRR